MTGHRWVLSHGHAQNRAPIGHNNGSNFAHADRTGPLGPGRPLGVCTGRPLAARAARRPRGEQVAFESPTTTLAPAIYCDHPHDFADSALAQNDVFRIENAEPQRRSGERGEARGNRCQSTGGSCRTRLGTLSFGIGTRGFMARRVSSSKCDTAQSRNGLSSAGTMYQGATGVEQRVRSMLKASWYSSQ